MATAFDALIVNLELCEATRAVRQLGIPPCPPLLADLIQETEQPQPDRGWVVQLIRQDAALARGLIDAVNSPLCGLRHKVRTLESAVVFAGLKYCTNFVAGFMLRRALGGCGMARFDSFWNAAAESAIAIAYLARELATCEFDDAHTFGLFRDCGIPLMTRTYAGYAGWVERAERGGLGPLVERERAQFGIDHALVGGLIARSWCLPETVWLPVSLHHTRIGAVDASDTEVEAISNLVAIGMLADSIARWRGPGVRTESAEAEQAYALRVLGVLPQELAAFRSEVALLLRTP
jgi:HD-like signal output (HDOD) protein